MNVFHVLGLAASIYAVQASGYADLLADLYMYNLDNPYNDKIADWDVVYPDTLSDPKEPRDYGETALRDQEYMKQLPISGYQFISGKFYNTLHCNNIILTVSRYIWCISVCSRSNCLNNLVLL